MIEPGKMRHHIIIDKPVSRDDGIGGRITATALATDTWASIETSQGKLSYQYGARYPDATHIFHIRYNPIVEPLQIITLGSRKFEIQSVQNVEELNEEMILLAKEVF